MERAELTRLILERVPGARRHPRSAGLVFLADPAWAEAERGQFDAWVGLPPPDDSGVGWLLIPSGGTSGALKFARHDEGTVAAAVAGFRRHFAADRACSVGVLPLHHVSGFMAWMRTALSGGAYVHWDWKRLEAGEVPGFPGGEGDFRTISLVPTQLQRLLQRPETVDWLRRFSAVFLGGGPPWPELLDAAQAARLRLSLGYGMTETAAMAAGQNPDDFLAGERSSGRPLPHIQVTLSPEETAILSGSSIFRGYYPHLAPEQTFATEDIVSIDDAGRIHLHGRRDAVIISGGKKIDPVEVESVLRKANLFSDVAIVGVPDAEWGQEVVACYPASDSQPSEAQLHAAIEPLSRHQRPKRFIPIHPWPRTPQGKINRPALAKRAAPLERGA